MTGRCRAWWLQRSSRSPTSRVRGGERVVRAVVAAAEARDERGLKRMLHPGVRLTIDGGGVVAAPASALEGASEVAGYLADVLFASSARLRVASVNGAPGVVVCVQGRTTGVLGVRARGRLILEAWLVVNTDKLRGWTC